MKVFTYHDYIEVIHTLRLNAVLQLAEESTNYKLIENEDHNKMHDKLVKSILKNKTEIVKFINQFISEKQNIKIDDIVKFTNSYVTKRYKSKEADLVYKLKNQDIFFLIEHQSTVDSRMPYRILNYCIDIMYEWCKGQKLKKIKEYPIIVPIVIYTGDRKWKIPQNFKDKQISTSVFENYKINLQYNLVEINRLSDEYLLSLNSMFGYSMLIEKSKDKKDLINKMDLIIKNTDNKRYLNELQNIILYALNGSLSNVEQKELIEKIDKKVGEEYMSTLIDRLTAENRRVLNEGIQKGIKAGIKTGIKTGMKDGIKTGMKTGMKNGIEKHKEEVVKKMLSMDFKEDMILVISGATKEEFEKIKAKTIKNK